MSTSRSVDQARTKTRPFIRAAHYFGNQWPVNFWSSFNWERVPEDMSQIREDGFNAVILVVPWYPFSPAADPEVLAFYSAGMRHIFQTAQDAGLYIILRVSYPHDTLGDVSGKANKLCEAIIAREPEVTALWQASLQEVQGIATGFANYIYAFFSWEDMWCAIKKFPDLDAAARRSTAKRTGFQGYAFDRLGKDLASYLSGREIETPSEISIPPRRSPLFLVYKQFVEEIFEHHLIPLGRKAIPNLGFEARLDREPVDTTAGATYWASYNPFPHDGLRASYWAPFMGQKNAGETIDADTALRSLHRVLDRIADRERGSPHLLEQFNFFGNTPEFRQSARIRDEEIPAFLQKAGTLLRDQTAGYGLWTYRDYRHNYVANAAFNMGLAAFEVAGDAELVAISQTERSLRVAGTARVSQQIAFQATLDHMKQFYDPLTFCLSVRAATPTPFKVRLYLDGRLVGEIDGLAKEASNRFCQELAFKYAGPERSARLRIEIKADGVTCDNLLLFNHVQQGGLYDPDGAPGPHLSDIRALNRRLQR